MKFRIPRILSRFLLALLVVLLAGILWLIIKTANDCSRLSCTLQNGVAMIKCENQSQLLERPPSTDAQELTMEKVQVARDQSSVLISTTLKGRFWNETDQNLYVFVGQTSGGAAPVSYSLTADTQYLADVSYPIRNTIELPHANDIRIGVMAPGEVSYSPQIYITDAVKADVVGADAHVETNIRGNDVVLRLPLAEYYQRKQTAVPQRLSFTVATARDYVGFIDVISVLDVSSGETKTGNARLQPPSSYPVLNYDSHVVKSLTLTQPSGAPLAIELESAAPINDWAQTNLHLFFVPVPNKNAGDVPADPSHLLTLPVRWSYYCAVYSPHRLFCKAPAGEDFSYDTGYSNRSVLEQPRGVAFKELGGTKYAFSISPEVVQQIKQGENAFAVFVTAGRDGFGPSSCFGFNCDRRCNILRRLKNALP